MLVRVYWCMSHRRRLAKKEHNFCKMKYRKLFQRRLWQNAPYLVLHYQILHFMHPLKRILVFPLIINELCVYVKIVLWIFMYKNWWQIFTLYSKECHSACDISISCIYSSDVLSFSLEWLVLDVTLVICYICSISNKSEMK